MKSRVHPKYKTKYRVGNWRSYERAPVHRGDVTLGFLPARGPRGDRRRLVKPVGRRGSLIKKMNTIGRRRWKKEIGYRRQARVENAFFRYKSIIGGSLRARSPGGRVLSENWHGRGVA